MAPEQLTEMGLEWEQLRGVQRPYGLRRMNRSTHVVLIALRVYALVAIPLVTFAFLRSLH